MLRKINELPDQFEKAWTSLWTKDLPIKADKIDRILIAGMGGSGIAGALAQEIFLDSPIPIFTWADYGVPGWVNDKTLFIAVSYSGDTEETLNATSKALERQAQVVAITKGGKLSEMAGQLSFSLVKIDYDSLPREALGYLYGSIITILAKLRLVDISETTYFAAVKELRNVIEQGKFASQAENLVVSLVDKIPLILSQSPLESVARRYVTQFNENSKTFAVSGSLPEICHNMVVGLDFGAIEKLQVLYLESGFAFSRNILRKKIIQKVFEGKNVPFVPLSMVAKSPLAEQWLFVHLGDLLSYSLAGVYGTDPSPITQIDELKAELKKA
jgi:glucose/mannose-6-phosphate isomerase